jgi:hypothetical protein
MVAEEAIYHPGRLLRQWQFGIPNYQLRKCAKGRCGADASAVALFTGIIEDCERDDGAQNNKWSKHLIRPDQEAGVKIMFVFQREPLLYCETKVLFERPSRGVFQHISSIKYRRR